MTSTVPKALDTVFDDRRFRSRTEAKWAVFLKVVKHKYEYEERGFDLPNGTWYLPDFYVPALRAWIEVKGVMTPKDSETLLAFARFQAEPILVVNDVPAPESYGPGFHVIGRQWRSEVVALQEASWIMTPRGALPEAHGMPTYITPEAKPDHGDLWLRKSSPVLSVFPDIEDAYRAARYARFEHGEEPGTEKLTAPGSGWRRPHHTWTACYFPRRSGMSLCGKNEYRHDLPSEPERISRCYECETRLVKREKRAAALPGQRSAEQVTW